MVGDQARTASSLVTPRDRRAAREAHRHATRAAAAEQLLALSAHLAESDRALIQAVYGRGLTIKAVAEIRAEPAAALRRRVARLHDRMTSPGFALAVARAPQWPEHRRRIARACFVEGLSMRAAAASLGLTIHAVRREVELIRALAEWETDPVHRATPRTEREAA